MRQYVVHLPDASLLAARWYKQDSQAGKGISYLTFRGRGAMRTQKRLQSTEAKYGVRSCITTLLKKGQQCVVRQIAGAMMSMETMRMIKMLKSHNRV
jgi:hypothetical protein